MAEGSGHRAGAAAANEAGDAYVRADGLAKSYGGVIAVADVSFSVAAGRTLALLGPSGCGKTTILRCLAGLETPNAGRVEIGGRTVFDAPGRVNLMPEERELGIVFQSYAVWPHMTVAENVGFPLKVRGVGGRELRSEVERILEMVGLLAWRDRPATALSGGQQQRVALARALVHKPSLVLFDEPMSNLDTQLREQMRVELKLLQEKLKFTAIYVTHDQAEAFALAETVAVLNQGRIETIGAPREVFRAPSTPFVAQFFGFNVLEGRITAREASRVQIELGGGTRVWGRSQRPLATGDRAVLCIRKEHIVLGTPAGGENAIPAVVLAASFQGLADEYVLAIGSVELRASGPAGCVEPGPLSVRLPAEHCLVLPGAID